ncbi:hypothetical protein RFI_23888 [Reticulomyxa filosa]|uniref:RanBP2-type domain-containing protein n=1 Tax=Reticulomyxa filosa TaxID=46433 RepID=X6MK90_RETFI|nr:hypothetical protein RFI_23888 [Reticulomyxa filosa]|eukprot:ETO13480.1 hypothetical protein RFI_23888 [Reticulomyxa filosa]
MNEFQARATVFLLENREWKERGNGLIKFVFNVKTQTLVLINSPTTKKEFTCRLKPKIRSKGPRAYVIRAESDESGCEKMILAVRFETEKESTMFRQFVETGSVMRTPGSTHHSNSPRKPNSNKNPSQHHLLSHGNNSGNNIHTHHQQGHDNNNAHIVPSTLLPTQEEGINPSNKHFMWVCPSCQEMNDIEYMKCHACDAKRPVPTSNERKVIGSVNVNNFGIKPVSTDTSNNVYETPLTGKTVKIGEVSNTNEVAQVTKSLTLTSENLDTFSKAFPVKRPTVEEVLVAQIQYWMSRASLMR